MRMCSNSSADEEKMSKSNRKTCYTLALRRSIKWKNEFTKIAKTSEKDFQVKMIFQLLKKNLEN